MPLYALLLGSLALSGVVMGVLHLVFQSPISTSWRIRPQSGQKKPLGSKRRRSVAINSVISPVMVFSIAYGGYESLFYQGPIRPVWLVLEVTAILVIYDFAYYLAHRFLFHGPLMQRQHAVHHAAKYPTAIDSLYVHPIETVVGLLLLMGATWTVGPVHIYAFAALFAIYSVANILIHSGLQVRTFPLNLLGAMSRKHDRHHVSMKSGNYASITPLFDHVFRTAE